MTATRERPRHTSRTGRRAASDRGGPKVVSLLEEDPELAEGLGAEALQQAQSLLQARVMTIARGPWEAPEAAPNTAYGLLVLEGLVAGRTRVGKAVGSELLGPGDVLRPWAPAPYDTVPATSEWVALAPARLALLDSRVTALLGRWPVLTVNLSARLLRRAQTLSYMLAVSHMYRVEDRLLGALWHIASRWGRVTPHGVTVPFALTHEMLGQLIGAQRPSVTCAMTVLVREGKIERRPDSFVLIGDPPGRSTGPAGERTAAAAL